MLCSRHQCSTCFAQTPSRPLSDLPPRPPTLMSSLSSPCSLPSSHAGLLPLLRLAKCGPNPGPLQSSPVLGFPPGPGLMPPPQMGLPSHSPCHHPVPSLAPTACFPHRKAGATALVARGLPGSLGSPPVNVRTVRLILASTPEDPAEPPLPRVARGPDLPTLSRFSTMAAALATLALRAVPSAWVPPTPAGSLLPPTVLVC